LNNAGMRHLDTCEIHSKANRTLRRILWAWVLGRTNRLLSLIRHGPHWKRRVQPFFYRCVCMRYRGNVSTEPLPSKDKGIFTDPLPSNDRGIQARTHKQTGTWFISLLYFFKIRKVG
jgi:hypothetical protein